MLADNELRPLFRALFGLLFSASAELIDFASGAYQRRSGDTSGLLWQLAARLRREGFAVSYTMQDFRRDFVKEHFPELTPEEREDVLKALPPEERLAGLSAEQIRQYLDRLTSGRPAATRKPRRKR